MKTNQTRLLAVLTAAALLLGGGCMNGQNRKTTVRGSKNLITKTFALDPFKTIDASGMYNITYCQTDGAPRVEVTTSDNVMEFVEVSAKGGDLKLSLSEKHRYDVKKLEVRAYSATLEGLCVRGAADVSIKDGLTTRSLDIVVTGAGDLDLKDIDVAGDVKIQINGAGDVDIRKISAEAIAVKVSGAGDVDVKEIDSDSVSVVISGTGNAVLTGTTGTAKLKVSGVGNINATGLKADNYDASKSGIGSIKY